MSDTEKVPETTPEAAAPKTEVAATEAATEAVTTEPAAAESTPAESAAAEPAAAEVVAEKSEAAEPAAAAEEKTEEKPTEETSPQAEADVSAENTEGAEASKEEAKTDDKAKATEEEIVEEPPEPIIIPEGNGELVLVTGATGFLGSHIVKQLVEGGEYRVRGTVRSLEDNSKLDALKTLVGDNSKYPVEFVEADLTNAESWTEAVKGCEFVIHTASPFPTEASKTPNEVIDTARDGTLSVLKACVATGTVKRLVITSSIVAISAGRTLGKNACTEEMWANVKKCPNTYDKSKAVTEKAAWDYVQNELPEGCEMELSVVNHGFLVGPPLMKMDCTSIEVLKKLMNREYASMPQVSYNCADVRDVALGHIRAMVIKQAAGKRHIMCKPSVWLKDMANIMSQEFNSQGFNITTSQSLLTKFTNLVKAGKICNFDTKRMTEVLQVETREVKDSLLEMGHSMINLDIVQKLEKQEKKSRTMSFGKKKEKELKEGEEKKDEPEKAGSTSDSAENESVPEAVAIEDVDVITEDKPAEVTESVEQQAEVVTEEVKSEPEDSAATHSEEEVKDEAAGSSDPESSKKKDKKEKPKKEKKEKKKGGLFSFSFKKSKKPHVEKKNEEADAGSSDETPATEDPATVTEDTTAAATTTEEATAKEEVASKEEVAAKEEAKTTEAPAAEVAETPAVEEAAAETPTTEKEEPEVTPKEEKTTEEVKEVPAAAEETSSATESSEQPDKPTEQTPSS